MHLSLNICGRMRKKKQVKSSIPLVKRDFTSYVYVTRELFCDILEWVLSIPQTNTIRIPEILGESHPGYTFSPLDWILHFHPKSIRNHPPATLKPISVLWSEPVWFDYWLLTRWNPFPIEEYVKIIDGQYYQDEEGRTFSQLVLSGELKPKVIKREPGTRYKFISGWKSLRRLRSWNLNGITTIYCYNTVGEKITNILYTSRESEVAEVWKEDTQEFVILQNRLLTPIDRLEEKLRWNYSCSSKKAILRRLRKIKIPKGTTVRVVLSRMWDEIILVVT